MGGVVQYRRITVVWICVGATECAMLISGGRASLQILSRPMCASAVGLLAQKVGIFQ